VRFPGAELEELLQLGEVLVEGDIEFLLVLGLVEGLDIGPELRRYVEV